jgi:hypothetical protein
VVPTKAQKAYGYIEPIKIDILKLRICDKETMKRKKIHAADDPRLISSTIAPAPPTAELVLQHKSRIVKISVRFCSSVVTYSEFQKKCEFMDN